MMTVQNGSGAANSGNIQNPRYCVLHHDWKYNLRLWGRKQAHDSEKEPRSAEQLSKRRS